MASAVDQHMTLHQLAEQSPTALHQLEVGTSHGRASLLGRCSAWRPLPAPKKSGERKERSPNGPSVQTPASRLCEEGPPVDLWSAVRVNLPSWLAGLERRSCLWGLLGGRTPASVGLAQRRRLDRSRSSSDGGVVDTLKRDSALASRCPALTAVQAGHRPSGATSGTTCGCRRATLGSRCMSPGGRTSK